MVVVEMRRIVSFVCSVQLCGFVGACATSNAAEPEARTATDVQPAAASPDADTQTPTDSTTQEATSPGASDAASTSSTDASNADHCKTKQDECTDGCKASTVDTASRQSCYTHCLKQADRCREQQ